MLGMESEGDFVAACAQRGSSLLYLRVCVCVCEYVCVCVCVGGGAGVGERTVRETSFLCVLRCGARWYVC